MAKKKHVIVTIEYALKIDKEALELLQEMHIMGDNSGIMQCIEDWEPHITIVEHKQQS